MLRFVAADMEAAQTEGQQAVKGQGQQPGGQARAAEAQDAQPPVLIVPLLVKRKPSGTM